MALQLKILIAPEWQKLIRIFLRLAEPMRNIQKHRVRQARLGPEPTTA